MPDGDKFRLFEQINKYADVVKDRPDLRDLFYLPTLRPLVRFRSVPDILHSRLLPVRNQMIAGPGRTWNLHGAGARQRG